MEKILLPDFEHLLPKHQGSNNSMDAAMLSFHILAIGLAIYSIGSIVVRYRKKRVKLI